MTETIPFDIPQHQVSEAYLRVKANKGGAGVDKQSIEQFERRPDGNLYKIWHRMASGTYFPPPIKAVLIAKKSEVDRILGVPCIRDRVVQGARKLILEPIFESDFQSSSFGYRPKKTAHEAINIDHHLLKKAVKRHTDNPWFLLYIERRITAPVQEADGRLVARNKGVQQGGVISPVLSNLFMHYAFDAWMERAYSDLPWCRYADDGLAHCRSQAEAEQLRAAPEKRLHECGLKMHPVKTKIVY